VLAMSKEKSRTNDADRGVNMRDILGGKSLFLLCSECRSAKCSALNLRQMRAGRIQPADTSGEAVATRLQDPTGKDEKRFTDAYGEGLVARLMFHNL